MAIESVAQAVFVYRSFGWNLVPLGADKRPVVIDNGRYIWKQWADKKQSDAYWQTIQSYDWFANVRGVGAVCGPVSGHLLCIDFDGLDNGEHVADVAENLGFGRDYPWQVCSPGGGYHLWIVCPSWDVGKVVQPGIVARAIELRYTGHYVVLPPSVHPTGNLYTWVGDAPTTPPATVTADRLREVYNSITTTEIPAPLPVYTPDPTPIPIPAKTNTPTNEVTPAYVAAALDGELNTLARTSEGGRNDALNRAAFALGQLVGDGLLLEVDVAERLTATALAIGLDEKEAQTTARSGLRAGQREPRGLRLHTNGHAHKQSNGTEQTMDAEPQSEESVPAATPNNNSPSWVEYVAAAQKLGYTFRLNDLADKIEVNGEKMTDVHEAVILSQLHAIGFKGVDIARRAFVTAGAKDRYHPVKEYLDRLSWDRQDSIAQLAGYFIDKHDPIVYQDGTQRTVFHAFLRRWLVGAVGKVYNARDNQNPMLILAGDQNSGKSYFAKWICPLADLHFEGAIKPDDKDYVGYLSGFLVWEVGELGATMRKADRESLKQFLTQTEVTYRPSYGRHSISKPAMASFIGTVNPEGALLNDTSGHRRFRPVSLTKIDWDYSQDVDLSQIWAQAHVLYTRGETSALSMEEKIAHALITETYEAEDVLAGYVLRNFTVDPNDTTLWTPTTEILDELHSLTGGDLGGDKIRRSMELAKTLDVLGLKKAKRRYNGTPLQGWIGIVKK